MSPADRKLPGWLLPVGLAVGVALLVAIALLRGPVELDPDSPEGTVQEYLVAISEERWDDAIEILHEEWRGNCTGGDVRSMTPGDFTAAMGAADGFGGFAAREPFEQVGDGPPPPEPEEKVEVTIRHNDGGLGSGWDEYVVFELVDEDDFWWLAGDPWPYFVWSCR